MKIAVLPGDGIDRHAVLGVPQAERACTSRSTVRRPTPQDGTNPLATILSAAMMLRYSLDRDVLAGEAELRFAGLRYRRHLP